jgi:hypothetical protein
MGAYDEAGSLQDLEGFLDAQDRGTAAMEGT